MAETDPPPDVHPTAVLRGDVQLAPGVVIGPYVVIDGPVTLGRGTRVFAHTVIGPGTTVGADCKLGPHATVGTDPQDRSYDGGPTCLVVGDRVIVREFASVHRANKPGLENATRIGSGTLLMATSHVAHDCVVGENVVMVNGTMLGGHVIVGNGAVIGGDSQVHQFARIGRLAIVGSNECALRDVVPFGALRNKGHKAYNIVGVRRSGMPAESVRAIRRVFTDLHRAPTFVRGLEALRARPDFSTLPPEVQEIAAFAEGSKRGIHGTSGAAGSDD